VAAHRARQQQRGHRERHADLVDDRAQRNGGERDDGGQRGDRPQCLSDAQRHAGQRFDDERGERRIGERHRERGAERVQVLPGARGAAAPWYTSRSFRRSPGGDASSSPIGSAAAAAGIDHAHGEARSQSAR
jgi:hypothetical protein